MTTEVTPAPPAAEPYATVAAVASYLQKLDPAALAELRRADGQKTEQFWLLAQLVLEPRGQLSGAAMPVVEAEDRWARVASLMATLQFRGLLVHGVRAGVALGAFLKEPRLARLLEARSPSLYPEARRVVAYAISQRAAMNFSTLAELILLEGTARHARCRDNVARDYYRAATSKKTAPKPAPKKSPRKAAPKASR